MRVQASLDEKETQSASLRMLTDELLATLMGTNLAELSALAPAFSELSVGLNLDQTYSLRSHFMSQAHFDPLAEFDCRLLTMGPRSPLMMLVKHPPHLQSFSQQAALRFHSLFLPSIPNHLQQPLPSFCTFCRDGIIRTPAISPLASVAFIC